MHLRPQALQKPTNYLVQIDFCYKNSIWVWAVYDKTVEVPSLSMTLLNVLVLIFAYLFLCKKCVCRNFGKLEIAIINGMPRFFFSRRSAAILTWGFSKSYFTNLIISNFEWDDLSEYIHQKSFHICLSSKSNTWILILFLEYFVYRNLFH